MTAKMYYDADADPAALAGQTSHHRFGSQGHAHALTCTSRRRGGRGPARSLEEPSAGRGGRLRVLDTGAAVATADA